MEKVRFIENGLVIKCWRMKGMKEYMPEFAEAMMDAAGKFIRTVDKPKLLNADVYMCTEDSTWCIDMFVDKEAKIKGTLKLTVDSTNEKPNAISLIAGSDNFALNFGDIEKYSSYEECFHMMYAATLVITESK